MPSSSRLSQPPVKKQQSIAHFFTKTPAPAAQKSSTVASRSNDEQEVNVQDGEDIFFVDRESGLSLRSERAVETPKRTLTAFEEGEESISKAVLLPARKKARRSESSIPANEDEYAQYNNPVSLLSRDAGENSHTLHPITSNGSRPKISERTARYLFSSSPKRDEKNLEDEHLRQTKERLHERFVKKLGRPDSITEIKRRNWQNVEDGPHGAEEDDEEVEEEEATNKGKNKRVAAKNSASKLTPMEKQMLDIKRKHLDTILVIEVGYKFRFFGEDARTAAKELSIVCIPGKMRYDEHASEAHLSRFASASIPVHRLHVHVKRLVAAGHKVGVVRQLETAALKAAGDNRNTPFIRRLTNLYTKGTYIDDVQAIDGPDDAAVTTTASTGYLLCLTETRSKGLSSDEKVQVGMVAVQPATGDVIYDDFEDGFMRSEIETRLLHIAACEFLVVGDLTKSTEKLLQHLTGSKTNVFGDRIRVERVERPKTMAASSYSHVSNFYSGKMKANSQSKDENASALLDKVLKLAENVTICLSAMITHMSAYRLEHVFDLTKYFQSFSARSHMLLNGTTVTSLEIYQNQTDSSEKGSLFWALDRTSTRFGKRLLRKWVGRPLLDKARLEERIEAVEELMAGDQTTSVGKIKQLLKSIKSDLEKSLIRIYYGRCTRPELLLVLQTMQRIAAEFAHVKTPKDSGFRSDLVNQAIASLPTIVDPVVDYLEKINPQAAKDDDKYAFFRADDETDQISEHKLGIAVVEHGLNEHRAVAAEKIGKKKVEYVTVAAIEYLIEVDNTQLKKVPASWAKISGTKKLSRFHTPEVVKMIRERDRHKEALAAACDTAFTDLLANISSKYQIFRDCIQALAQLDCLLSLAAVANQPGYVKPEYTQETCISVVKGRHPMVEQIILEAYVANDIDLATDRTRALLITGPNMGGKSSYVRQVALIAIMGQIGSYVPAESAKLGMLDAVFTRMGAFDNMMAGESTFMVELSETSDILKQASSRSLIILDELGRGTSTHDGVAIAQAVLDYVVREKKSLTLFITHYQNLSALANGFQNGELKNVHMRFTESGENSQDITFLYEVGEGVAHRSYGLNVARLAKVPESVLAVAAVKSKQLEDEAQDKKMRNISRLLLRSLRTSDVDQLDLLSAFDQL